MHIFVCVPSYSGAVQIECLTSIFKLQSHLNSRTPPVRLTLSWVTGVMIDVARNILAHRFMKDRSATHLLFVDDDMGFEPSLIDRLMNEDKPLVSTFCPSRHFDIKSGVALANADLPGETLMSVAADYVATGHILHENGQFDPNENGFVRVSSIGTGIMLIRREVFEAIGTDDSLWSAEKDSRYPRIGIHEPVLQAFAPKLGADGIWLSEDLSFCARWTATGGEIWACVDEMVTHVGRMAVRGRLRDRLDHFGGL